MNQQADENNTEQGQTLISHLTELRSRLLHCIIFVLILFAVLSCFANDIYSFLASPLFKHLSPDGSMIATEVASPFIAPFKLAFFVAVFISMPYLIYQMWLFVAPGLYDNEKDFVRLVLGSGIVLFYAGIVFAYYVILPILFGFFTAVAPDGVTVMTDISRYLDFVIKIFFAFGLAFEVPVVTMLLIWSGFTSVDILKKSRPYCIVGAFVIGMLLTPPDVLSQILLALPVWGLFELGLLLGARLIPKSKNE